MTDLALKYSIIVPVYNRLEEVKELLESAEKLDFSRSQFEFLFVDDGSTDGFKEYISGYQSESGLQVRAIFQQNQGPANARNNGMANTTAEYMLFIDSDCMLPPQWLKEIDNGIKTFGFDAFGGPDTFHHSFSPLLKAINYSMTSFITTGGIRGGKKSLEKFKPRSFNMGISREVFEKTKGFSKELRFGEDLDFSYRIIKSGFQTGLIPDAFVYHKRRTDFKKFFKQVFNSGIARINLSIRHPKTLKITHCLPAIFVAGLIVLLFASLWYWWFLLPILLLAVLIFANSSIKNKSVKIGFMSVPAGFIQTVGYGSGFLIAFVLRFIFRKKEFYSFRRNFYK